MNSASFRVLFWLVGLQTCVVAAVALWEFDLKFLTLPGFCCRLFLVTKAPKCSLMHRPHRTTVFWMMTKDFTTSLSQYKGALRETELKVVCHHAFWDLTEAGWDTSWDSCVIWQEGHTELGIMSVVVRKREKSSNLTSEWTVVLCPVRKYTVVFLSWSRTALTEHHWILERHFQSPTASRAFPQCELCPQHQGGEGESGLSELWPLNLEATCPWKPFLRPETTQSSWEVSISNNSESTELIQKCCLEV